MEYDEVFGDGMPKGNKKAGFIGLMIAKKHLRRGPNDYVNGKPKKTPARFNSNLMAELNRHGKPNPSAYIQEIYPRRQVAQREARPRGRPRKEVATLAPTGRLTKAQRDALKTQAQQGNAQAIATLDAFRAQEKARQVKARDKKKLAEINAMPNGPEKEQALRNYQITIQLRGTGGRKPTPKEDLDLVKTSYMVSPPQDVGAFRLFFNTPTLDGWVDENSKTIVLSVRGTNPTDKQDLYADANIALNRLSKTPRYIQDKNSVAQILQRYDPSKYEIYLVGHSLGGAIANQLKRDFPMLKDAEEYNPAFQPYDLISQQSNSIHRNYVQTDPLYRIGGRFFLNKSVVPPKTAPTASNSLGVVGQLYDAYAGHALDNFATGGAKMISMPKKEYLAEHKHLFDVLAHPTPKKLQAELHKQQHEVAVRGMAKPMKHLVDMHGKPYKGHYHICPNGEIHSGKKHGVRSKQLQVV